MQAASNAGTPCASRPAIMPDEHVAGAGGRKPGRRVGGDGGAAVGRGHHRVRPLQQHDGAGALGGSAHPLELRAKRMLVADIAEQPRKFALMRRQNDLRIVRRLDRLEQPIGRIGKTRQRIRIEHQMPRLRRQRREHEIARALADAGARPDHAGVEALVVKQSRRTRSRYRRREPSPPSAPRR